MANVIDQLDQIEAKIMCGLKDFQKATVERIAFLYTNGQSRVLVSDEVGLGKTLVAKGVVAKTAKIRKEENDDLFKVVYVCSNSAIADQNLRKLRISKDVRIESSHTSRLSMQHLNIFEQENDIKVLQSYIQLIPLTPSTSFHMTSGNGTVDERALMFAILRHIPELKDYLPELEIAMQDWATKAWSSWCKKYYEERVQDCDKKSDGEYLRYMLSRLEKELASDWKGGKTLLDGLIDYCMVVRKDGWNGSFNGGVISALRTAFAKISLDKLEPDLVIMDEFQRFKYLLNATPDSDVGMLTNKFFHSKDVRMLLLSATPFKLYSTLDEIDETHIDEHYEEFLTVMRFLNEGTKRQDQFATVWKDYSVKLKELTIGETTLLSAKRVAENAMYQSVCRTERISAEENADIIDDSDVDEPLEVLEADILSYVQAQQLLDQIGAGYHVPVDYIKSTPYLMSFMRDYQLKKNVKTYFEKHPEEVGIIRKSTFWLNRNKIDRYERIPNNNARLDRVMNASLEKGMDQVLWIPPSRPYYPLEGVFKGKENTSKTLVFSSWEMVPRMISCLISYEAERRTVGKLVKEYREKDAHYFASNEKRYPAPRMRFSVSYDRPTGMALFCLLYPSQYLTKLYDPVEGMNEGLTLSAIRSQIKSQLEEKLSAYSYGERGQQDARWYYLAPLLLDDPGYVLSWLGNKTELAEYDEEGKDKTKGFLQHLDYLQTLYERTKEAPEVELGRRPDDLLDVLTDMAIASPAICLSRSYQLYQKDGTAFASFLPSQFARVFINRMNTPESIAAIELACGRKSEDAHWKNVLAYSAQGGFQAVLDEYVHLLASGIDDDEGLVEQIHQQLLGSINIRTTQYEVDTFSNFKGEINGRRERLSRMRSHYAVAFTKGLGKESDADRKKVIRNAFNSPFRPFVLATTSIGQEGLDFHNYCRRIVHWNLPSNPIDLEQREGRINRFECLAIRQNVAMRYGDIHFESDVWKEMFEEAERVEKTKGVSDLIPYWGLTERPDMVKIERMVPMFPFSRDGMAYERLIKILSLYRLTLGQARQEELLEYLIQKCDDPDKLSDLFINLSPYYKKHPVKVKVKVKRPAP